MTTRRRPPSVAGLLGGITSPDRVVHEDLDDLARAHAPADVVEVVLVPLDVLPLRRVHERLRSEASVYALWARREDL
jgi:hypothetical protein